MENALWNGKLYTAAEIAESYELEKSIRKASGRKELRCPDADCSSPVLRYCHGEIKSAFFAHLDNCTCDYAEFDKENTQLMRKVKRTIYESFVEQGYDVQLEVKLLPRHYTHLLFTMSTGKKIAVELGTQRTTANRIDYLSEQYERIGVDVKWIVISNSQTPVKENETFFIKRYILNESKRKDILVLNWDGTEITQYIVDPNKYLYRGNSIYSENYPEIYSETAGLEALAFEEDELTIRGFHSRYNEWLIRKRAAFDKKLAQMAEEAALREKRMRERQEEYERQEREGVAKARTMPPIIASRSSTTYSRPSTPSMSYEARRESILPRMDQQTEQVRDATGARWIRCEICGSVETEDKFWSYGGANHVNLGTCYKCGKK